MASIVINAGSDSGNNLASQSSPGTHSPYPTSQENKAVRWQVRLVCGLVLTPCLIGTAATAFFSGSLGWQFGSSVSDRALLAGLALIPVTLTAGLPLVASLIEHQDSHALWGRLALHSLWPSPVAYGFHGPAEIKTAPTEAERRLQGQIAAYQRESGLCDPGKAQEVPGETADLFAADRRLQSHILDGSGEALLSV
jgi:hypothetical protein